MQLMMKEVNFMEINGIITAMVTPMSENEKINVQGTKDLINRLISKKVDGLFILGTNGEFHTLSNQEKIDFATLVIETVNHRVPVYVGTGGNSTKEVIELSKIMESLGADALSVITPYFLTVSEQELLHHYRSIAESVNIPIILYNIPENTGINLHPELVKKLAKIPNIQGIKDSSGKIENIKRYLEETRGQDFSVLVGSDSKIYEALKLGAHGAIAATANVITENDVNIYQYFKSREFAKAEKCQEDVNVLRKVLHKATTPAVLKAAVNLLGIEAGSPRLPVAKCKPEVVDEMKQCLDYFNLEHK